MNKILFVYNPFSGERIILNYLDKIIELHEKSGYTVHIKRIQRTEELQKFLRLLSTAMSIYWFQVEMGQ